MAGGGPIIGGGGGGTCRPPRIIGDCEMRVPPPTICEPRGKFLRMFWSMLCWSMPLDGEDMDMVVDMVETVLCVKCGAGLPKGICGGFLSDICCVVPSETPEPSWCPGGYLIVLTTRVPGGRPPLPPRPATRMAGCSWGTSTIRLVVTVICCGPMSSCILGTGPPRNTSARIYPRTNARHNTGARAHTHTHETHKHTRAQIEVETWWDKGWEGQSEWDGMRGHDSMDVSGSG